MNDVIYKRTILLQYCRLIPVSFSGVIGVLPLVIIIRPSAVPAIIYPAFHLPGLFHGRPFVTALSLWKIIPLAIARIYPVLILSPARVRVFISLWKFIYFSYRPPFFNNRLRIAVAGIHFSSAPVIIICRVRILIYSRQILSSFTDIIILISPVFINPWHC
jgi:hypothetical protein